MGQVLLSVASIALLVFTLVDIITIDSWRIRHLDKIAWAIIVILLPLIGAVLWFAIGRERTAPVDRGGFGDPRRSESTPAIMPSDDDIEAAVEREIEYHEREARLRRLEAELRERRGEPDQI